LLTLESYGQQAPVFTHHYSSLMFSNPAYAGMNEGICVHGIYRQQWAGFNDQDGNSVAPQDFLLTVDSPVRLFHGGVGGSIIQDKLGQQSDIIVQLDYSFHTELSIGTLGIGAGLNIINRNIDFTKFVPGTTDPLINGLGNESDMRLDASFGLFLSQSGQYYFGISATNLLQTKFKKLDPSGEGITMTDRTFYITGGYNFVFPNNPLFEVQPSVMILSDFASTQYNVSAVVKYNDKFWGGINYRVQESIGIMVGMQFKDFRISYAYDINTLKVSVPGSHEVSLGYCFKIKGDRSKTSYKNTRYL
jgi:type IX secretion system PorP/SprF family membrane protein